MYPITPIILAGGKGERLWPLSRQDYPKQILPLVNETSLLTDTAERVSHAEYFHAPIVICNDAIRFFVLEQLNDYPPSHVVIEPVGRNTAPAIAIAALMLKAQQNAEALMLILPSDHAISDINGFLTMIERSTAFAKKHKLVIFGMKPDSSHTGYGYIKCGKNVGEGGYQVEAFVEKPDAATAQTYVDSGEYDWNSGMFLMTAGAYLEELARYAPEVLAHATLALEHAQDDLNFLRLSEEHFASCPNISIDYAIMEKTTNAIVVPAEIGWSDLGSWDAVWQMTEKDEHGNAKKGDVLIQDCSDSYLRSDEGQLLACSGLNNMVVVNTRDATFVGPMDHLGNIKELTKILNNNNRKEIKNHMVSFRPWGNYTLLVEQPGFQVKRIVVKCGGKLSLQSHYHRSEHWVVVRGTAKVTCEEKAFILHENESTFIPSGSKHRLENPGKIDLELIEIQVGSYLGEDDIVRYDDVYGRNH